MKNVYKFVLTCALIPLWAGAQVSYDEFKAKAQERFEAFRQRSNDEFEAFRKKANDEYAAFLRNAWARYESIKSPVRPKDDSPVPPKPYIDNDIPVKDTPRPFDEIIEVNPPGPQPSPVVPIEEDPVDDDSHEFTFFGTTLKVRPGTDFSLKGCDGNSIADGWETLSNGKHDNLVVDCLAIRKDMALCDWAYLLLVRDLAQSLAGNDYNKAALLMAYIYCQSGYKIKLAHSGDRLYMLYGSEHTIYDKNYFLIDGTRYYPFDCDEKELSICDAQFPGEKPMSLYVPSVPGLSGRKSDSRKLVSGRYSEASVEVSIDKNIIDFYDTYPSSEIGGNFMTRWAMYAQTPLSRDVRDTLYPALRSAIEGKSQLQAAETLLNWVQTAFVYEYDNKVWGYDRAFFAEETLYYPYCDCEDRSILFSRIVRDLMGLDVILVYYPGHLATAVKFTDNVSGDYLSLSGSKFTVCDPTYINAPVGCTMPGMDNASAKVIILK